MAKRLCRRRQLDPGSAGDRNRIEGSAGLPPKAAGRAVEEYLAVLDGGAFGAASEVTPKFIAPADPATQWTAASRGNHPSPGADHLAGQQERVRAARDRVAHELFDRVAQPRIDRDFNGFVGHFGLRALITD